jgi:hypothetical protein
MTPLSNVGTNQPQVYTERTNTILRNNVSEKYSVVIKT